MTRRGSDQLVHAGLCLWILSWLGCMLILPSRLWAQDLPIDPQLLLVGPAGQEVAVAASYYDDGQLTKTVAMRLKIRQGKTEPLEFGHAGLQLAITVPTAQPVTMVLMNGEEELSRLSVKSVGVARLKHGDVGDQPPPIPPRALPDVSEKQVIERFMQCLQSAEARELVSTSPMANIEWETLNAYLRTLQLELGPVVEAMSSPDGWLSWEGRLGARVLSKRLQLEHGQCQISLMIVDNRLVDVEVDSPEMPDDWFDGPSSIDNYRQRSARLSKLVFEGKVGRVREMLAPPYRKEISDAELQQLSQHLRAQLGSDIQKIDFKGSKLHGGDEQAERPVLSVFHGITLDTDRRCISEVKFVFTSGRNRIGLGELASIDVREAFQSAAPELAQIAGETLRIVDGQRDPELDRLWHPSCRAVLDSKAIEQRLQGLPNDMTGIEVDVDWDRWQAGRNESFAWARGPVSAAGGEVLMRVSFVDDQLFGFALESGNSVLSTFEHVAESDEIAEITGSFWRAIYEDELATAHALLAQGFQQQMPLDAFRELVQSSGLRAVGDKLVVRPVNVRLVSHPQRPALILTASYCDLLVGDQTLGSVRCILKQRESEAIWEVIDFSQDFDDQYVTVDRQLVAQLGVALQSGQPSALRALQSKPDQQLGSPELAAAFLRRLHHVAGDIQVPDESLLRRSYEAGRRNDRITCRLHSAAGSIPLTAEFRYGRLASFQLDLDGFGGFLSELNDTSVLEQAGLRFVDQWHSEAGSCLPLMVRELRSESVQNRLRILRGKLVQAAGAYQGSRVLEVSLSNDSQQAQLQVESRYERRTVRIQLELSVNALAALISAVDAAESAIQPGFDFGR